MGRLGWSSNFVFIRLFTFLTNINICYRFDLLATVSPHEVKSRVWGPEKLPGCAVVCYKLGLFFVLTSKPLKKLKIWLMNIGWWAGVKFICHWNVSDLRLALHNINKYSLLQFFRYFFLQGTVDNQAIRWFYDVNEYFKDLTALYLKTIDSQAWLHLCQTELN